MMVEGLPRLCLVPYVTDRLPLFVRENAAKTFDSPESNTGPSHKMLDKLLIGDKVQLDDQQANTAPPNIPFLALSATSRFWLSMGSILDSISTSTKLGVSLNRIDEDPTMTLLPATTMFLRVSEGIVGQKERQDTAATWSNTPSVTVSILIIFIAFRARMSSGRLH